ncbi:hypothetical protein J132_10606 [Termitomyces sp. J132]|nr:hypothetical protein J132_10606 [Termitomyces sp. J132]
MTPTPHAPTIWTISHILKPVQRMILDFDLLPTKHHPTSTAVPIRVIPLIVDLQAISHLTSHELEKIHLCIAKVHLPTWAQHPPTNIGEASHGNLKAHELLVLFSIIFPIIIPTLWWSSTHKQQALLQNFCDLVAATNIIAAYSVMTAEADKYTEYYARYCALM